ncbi:TM2 domain-containing protein [Hymenobacter sp. BT175]|uniref:TM2 domain-containing protein n=1 Tax=Hymenobacter translucens TaxID=2886507 RepID=UPI001D0E3651|nr:TM2 domain-containing protein [Hymenobacter translucens]MCC2546882.1 TM2 domain-containing protein [Hymenobacter translucens]
MKKFFSYLSVAVLSAASLSSCSRSNYAFQPGTSPYHASQAVTAAAPAAEATASVEAAAPVAIEAAPAQVAAKALAAPAKRVASPRAVAAPVAAKAVEAPVVAEKVAAKAPVAPAAPAAEGKSQIVAAVLAFLVGWLGVHRFYLGYTGIGIVQILTFGGFFGIWPLIDLVRICMGSLKPKGGDYAKKFGDK